MSAVYKLQLKQPKTPHKILNTFSEQTLQHRTPSSPVHCYHVYVPEVNEEDTDVRGCCPLHWLHTCTPPLVLEHGRTQSIYTYHTQAPIHITHDAPTHIIHKVPTLSHIMYTHTHHTMHIYTSIYLHTSPALITQCTYTHHTMYLHTSHIAPPHITHNALTHIQTRTCTHHTYYTHTYATQSLHLSE